MHWGSLKYVFQVPERCVGSKASGSARMPRRRCLVRSLRLLDCDKQTIWKREIECRSRLIVSSRLVMAVLKLAHHMSYCLLHLHIQFHSHTQRCRHAAFFAVFKQASRGGGDPSSRCRPSNCGQ